MPVEEVQDEKRGALFMSEPEISVFRIQGRAIDRRRRILTGQLPRLYERDRTLGAPGERDYADCEKLGVHKIKSLGWAKAFRCCGSVD
jgi:hypothetical protein